MLPTDRAARDSVFKKLLPLSKTQRSGAGTPVCIDFGLNNLPVIGLTWGSLRSVAVFKQFERAKEEESGEAATRTKGARSLEHGQRSLPLQVRSCIELVHAYNCLKNYLNCQVTKPEDKRLSVLSQDLSSHRPTERAKIKAGVMRNHGNEVVHSPLFSRIFCSIVERARVEGITRLDASAKR